MDGKRKRPQKALTRKDFRYKRDWKYHKENEREREFEEEDISSYVWWWMLLAGFAMIFFKFIVAGVFDPFAENAGESVSKVLTYGLSLFAVVGINILGLSIAEADGKKTRITGTVIKMISYIGFATLFYFLMYKGVH